MTTLNEIFRGAAQEIICDRLYFHIGQRDFDRLCRLAETHPILEKAVEESSKVGLKTNPCYLVPVDLINEAMK